MTALLSILRTTYCHSTHHYFAIDALPMVQTEPGQRLRRWLLRHHDRYLMGCTDPDTRFRDFQNHVVHADDGYWGGAPRIAHRWYERLVRYLAQDRWADAAHAAGVLSHYFTDPMQPLNTTQCDRSRVIYAPLQWSIFHAYQDIHRLWAENDLRVVFQLSERTSWLGEAILHGARFAKQRYQLLLDNFDLDVVAFDAQAALNHRARIALGELFGITITGWARVLERAAHDAEAVRRKPLPSPALGATTALTMLRVPATFWRRRMRFKVAQRQIENIVAEYRSTGTLAVNLPSEVDVIGRVRDVFRYEKRWKQERQNRLASRATTINIVDSTSTHDPLGTALEVSSAGAPATLPFVSRRQLAETDNGRGQLSPEHPVSDAPSIGPRTAAHFQNARIRTIGELLSASPRGLAKQLAVYWITGETITQWQAQATLMCQIPNLKVLDTQLLAGAGFCNAAQVVQSDPATIHRATSKFASTSIGRRHLRGAMPPALEEVRRWCSDASDVASEPRRSA